MLRRPGIYREPSLSSTSDNIIPSADTVICVQGPTASGKSELGEYLAQKLDGEIVSADSMQIYRGMDIGTAKVPPSKRHVPYHCLDIVNPGEPYSAALYQRDARAAIEDIQSRGKRSILVGGTGLYVRAVLDEMEFAPGTQEDNDLRAKLTEEAEELGPVAFHAKLAEIDPASAALIHPNNVRRVIRAFEMLSAGESYAKRKLAFKTVPAYFPSVKLALNVERQVLYERINERVDTMFDEGLVDEVKRLCASGYASGLTSMQAIGYKEIISALKGDMTFVEAKEAIKQATRRYAKRQLSWLAADKSIHWIDATEGITDEVLTLALKYTTQDISGGFPG